MKTLLFILMLVPYMSYSQCACACYDPNNVTDCTQSNCSQANFLDCLDLGLTWFQGAVNVPAGMCACEYLQILDLPVELISFTGDCNHLSWKTATEHNCSYFSVEETLDGEVWTSANINIPCGTTQSQSDYYVTIIPRYNLQYYRLLQYDLDGTVTTYGPITITCNLEKSLEGIYDLNGRYIGTEIPHAIGIYIMRYTDGSVTRMYLN